MTSAGPALDLFRREGLLSLFFVFFDTFFLLPHRSVVGSHRTSLMAENIMLVATYPRRS